MEDGVHYLSTNCSHEPAAGSGTWPWTWVQQVIIGAVGAGISSNPVHGQTLRISRDPRLASGVEILVHRKSAGSMGSGGVRSRHFEVREGGVLEITGVTLSGGNAMAVWSGNDDVLGGGVVAVRGGAAAGAKADRRPRPGRLRERR